MAKTGKKRNKRQILVAVLAGLLALLMILPMIFTAMTALRASGSGAGSKSGLQKEIDSLKNQNKDLAGQKADLSAQLKNIRADKSRAVEQKNLLERQISVLRTEIANLDQQIEIYGQLIGQKEEEVAQAKEREAERLELFCRQVRAMEEEGTQSYWSILFSATSFPDLLDRVNMVNDIADYERTVRYRLKEARQALEGIQHELEDAKADAETVREEQEAAKKDLQDQEAEVNSLISQIAQDEQQTQAAIKKLEEDAAAMDAAIKKKEKELQALIEEERRKAAAGQGSNKYQFDPGTGFYWPLPKERVSVTSFFGPRKDPFTGKKSNHSGTDIGAYAGTEIYAAHGGIVLTSEYHASYGNYVVLSRGDGITTLYAHMNKRAVKAGDVVKQGQVIGYVGSTGRSTAPHLHFEVRVNGVRQDALKYYPNVSWKNNTGFPYS